MAYDDDLADRVRVAVAEEFTEIKMFGGLAFMINGNMAVAVGSDDLMLRLPKEQVADALSRGAHEIRMGKRVMGGYVGVNQDQVGSDDALRAWVAPSVAFAASLPPKSKTD